MKEDHPVLVTGGEGFLGKHVLRCLLEGGRPFIVLDRARPKGDYPFIPADLSERAPDLAGRSFSSVYHLAGLAHVVPKSRSASQRFFDVNVTGTKNLLLGLERAERLPDAIVFVSTVSVYGLEEGEEVTEETPLRATDPYGQSKRMAEEAIVEWCHSHSVKVGIVRLPLVAGARAPGNLGAMVEALRRGRYRGIGDGNARRSMVLADDVAKILPKVAAIGGLFHLTDGRHPSFKELEDALCLAMGRRRPPRLPVPFARAIGALGSVGETITGRTLPFSLRIIDKMTKSLTFSDSKARRELNWDPTPVVAVASELVS